MSIALYLTFRIVNIEDMTAEIDFPIKTAVVVSQIHPGTNPWLATSLALLPTIPAGLASGMLHTMMKFPALLTETVTLSGLYSINTKIITSVTNLS